MIVTHTPAIAAQSAVVADARTAVAAHVRSAEAASPRAKRSAWRAVEQAESVRDFACADLERAVRAANPGAVEADLQAAVRAL